MLNSGRSGYSIFIEENDFSPFAGGVENILYCPVTFARLRFATISSALSYTASSDLLVFPKQSSAPLKMRLSSRCLLISPCGSLVSRSSREVKTPFSLSFTREFIKFLPTPFMPRSPKRMAFSPSSHEKFIPLLFTSGASTFIPILLQSFIYCATFAAFS